MFLLLLAAAAAGPEPLRLFGDWTVGCDNARHCKAVSLQPEEDFEASILSIQRDGDARAKPKIILGLGYDWAPVRAFVLDGRMERVSISADGEVAAPDLLRLAREIRKARRIDIADVTGKIIGHLSATGAGAALRWMDEQQNRAGTPSAIVAVGDRAVSTDAARSLPAIVPANASVMPPARLSAKQLAAIGSRYGCSAPGKPVEYVRLDAATSLALVLCEVGAYQKGSVAVLVSNAGRYRTPLFDFWWDEHWNQLIEPQLDPKTVQLWSKYKGRGFGDCGGTDGWVWDGKHFRLIYRDRMDECRGSGERITIWRTANHSKLWDHPAF